MGLIVKVTLAGVVVGFGLAVAREMWRQEVGGWDWDEHTGWRPYQG